MDICKKYIKLKLEEEYDEKNKNMKEEYESKIKSIKKECNEKDRLYRLTHKVEIKKYKRDHKIKLVEYAQKYNKDYYQKNKIKILSRVISYTKNRLDNDINFRLIHRIRKRIWAVLKGINKSKSTMKLVGCHIDLLRLHLQSKFQPGMSFSNYGKWHIDHIIPCARFDLSKASEQKKCFHYTNLQPLWAKENLTKNDKFIEKE